MVDVAPGGCGRPGAGSNGNYFKDAESIRYFKGRGIGGCALAGHGLLGLHQLRVGLNQIQNMILQGLPLELPVELRRAGVVT